MENDLISRAAAIAQIKENYCDWCDHTDLCKSCETHDCIASIEQHVPAVDAVPVVHARWIDHKDEHQCSECREFTIGDFYVWKNMPFDYCPHCGAKMTGGPDA